MKVGRASTIDAAGLECYGSTGSARRNCGDAIDGGRISRWTRGKETRTPGAPTVEEIARDIWSATGKEEERQDSGGNISPVTSCPLGKVEAADVERRHVIELVERKALDTPDRRQHAAGIIRGMFMGGSRTSLQTARTRLPGGSAGGEERTRSLLNEEARSAILDEARIAAKMAPECRSALRRFSYRRSGVAKFSTRNGRNSTLIPTGG